MTEIYTFTLPIGDWSDDGHGKCDFYRCEANKPVEEVREAHFKMLGTLGFSIEQFANRYQDSTVPKKIAKWLKKRGLELDKGGDGTYYISSSEMAQAWALMLQAVDPELTLTLVPDVPMLPFYGYREGKHIEFVGYGLF